MKPRLLYVEQSTGYNHNGPAWIGMGHFSKTGRTVYFNGKAFKGGRIGSNHHDILTGELYWISGIKKNAEDRHWAGSGKIFIDRKVVDDYLHFTGQEFLPKSKYEIIEFDESIPKELVNKIENGLSDV